MGNCCEGFWDDIDYFVCKNHKVRAENEGRSSVQYQRTGGKNEYSNKHGGIESQQDWRTQSWSCSICTP